MKALRLLIGKSHAPGSNKIAATPALATVTRVIDLDQEAFGIYEGQILEDSASARGSILDVPETAESRERMARLRARRLARSPAANRTPVPAEKIEEEAREAMQHKAQTAEK